MKPLLYLMNILGLALFILEERRGCRKFRTSTFMSVYSVAMLVIVLLGELLMLIGQGFREDMDNVYAIYIHDEKFRLHGIAQWLSILYPFVS
jgi:hypothetical protein